MWELVAIGCLFLFITGIAMRKSRRPSEFNSFSNKGSSINIDELARKIAQEMGKEFSAAFKELRKDLKTLQINSRTSSIQHSDKSSDHAIEMDESIIPINLSMNVEPVNLEGATKESKVIDKGLGNSKTKLAALRKNKEK